MPRQPSEKQKRASAKNLRGKQGPKTAEGKRRSAANGRLNKGPKTAAAKGKALLARHPKTNTFYAKAGCGNTCKKICLWSSFSPKTPHDELPLECLLEVLQDDPSSCFYYLRGQCIASSYGRQTTSRPICVVEPEFLEVFPAATESRSREKELTFRLQTDAWRKEVERYLDTIRRRGIEGLDRTPRELSALRRLQKQLPYCTPCVREPWRVTGEFDEEIEEVLDTDFT